MSPDTVEITFQPLGRKGRVGRHCTLLEAARELGVGLSAVCGGIGVCSNCRVVVPSESQAALSPPTPTESERLAESELERGVRMACQAQIIQNLWVLIPPESLTASQRIQVEGRHTPVELDPPVVGRDLALDPPSLEDLRCDGGRLRDALGTEIRISLAVLKAVSPLLRERDWRGNGVVRGDELVALLPPGDLPLGLAVDLGTTKLAGYLIDLETGETLVSGGEMNPQLAYGEDVMARITYALKNPHGPERLRTGAAQGIDGLLARMCEEAGVERDQVVEGVVVGNTAMHHLFLGLPTGPLGLAPYVSVESDPLDVPARELGLGMASGGMVHLLPNVAGFVGADHVAALLAARVDEATEPTLLLDVGTNTEICLASGGRLLSCSAASGPAFEGAHIRFGMRAAPGAIERVRLIEGQVFFETVGEEPPIGICGSGILDAVAELRRAGVLTERGGMPEGERVRRTERGPEYVLVTAENSGLGQDITISRRDVSEIQMAKAAIAAGWLILLEEAGIRQEDLARVIVAGAFGTYIDAQQARSIGMLPAVPPERFDQVGNVAGTGARMALVSLAERERAARIAERVEYVELTIHPAFSDLFARMLNL